MTGITSAARVERSHQLVRRAICRFSATIRARSRTFSAEEESHRLPMWRTSTVKQRMATDITSLLRRFAARWIDTSWRAIRPYDLRGECPQALAGTDHNGGLLIIEGTAIGMAGHTDMRARAMLVFSADVALAHIAREHKNLFWVAEESCLTPSHRRYPAAHTGRYGWAMAE